MKTKLAIMLVTMAMRASLAQAGEIVGRVSASPGVSAVYMEKIAGKTFPASATFLARPKISLVPATRAGGPGGSDGGFRE